MMFTKQIILFASIFAVICATKEHANENAYIGAEGAIATNHIYSQPIQDNIAAESEVAKRGAAVAAAATSAANNNENQGQSSQIDVGSSSSGSNGIISFTTPNSFQQFFSPSFGQFGGAIYATSLMPSSSNTNPQIFYVRAPQQYVAPSGVGTIKLSYTSNQAQPQTSVQYASTTPKVAYAVSPGQYQFALASTQPNPYTIAPVAIASPYTNSPYTTSAYTNPNGYTNSVAQLPSAALQQGQIIPYTASNGLFLSTSQLQQLGIALPQQSVGSSANVQPYAYSTATPIISGVPKIGTTVVTPTPAAYYSASPASQTYQQTPTFLSYQNPGLNYATAQKLVAVPTYTQASYRPLVPPTQATASSAYTNAYVQPTGISPIKYTLAQPANYNNYYSSAASYPGSAYAPKLAYAPVSATASPFVSSLQQSASQAIASAQAANTNGAIQYASQLYQPSSLTAAKYGYSQIPTAPKYFYASS